jgi:hypothetical protein
LVLDACDRRLANSTNGVDDVLIAGAPTEVALEPGANPFLGGMRLTLQQFQRAHDHAGGAKAALQRVTFAERSQQRVLRITGQAQALEGVNGCAVRLDGQDRARLHRAALQVNSARAALSRVAPNMHASDTEVLSEEVHEPPAGLDLGPPRLPIHSEIDLMT